jgi:hypothetical protein
MSAIARTKKSLLKLKLIFVAQQLLELWNPTPHLLRGIYVRKVTNVSFQANLEALS